MTTRRVSETYGIQSTYEATVKRAITLKSGDQFIYRGGSEPQYVTVLEAELTSSRRSVRILTEELDYPLLISANSPLV